MLAAVSQAAEPLVWFAPLDRFTRFVADPRYTGSIDYLDLFKPDAPWTNASRRVQVFKLYGGEAVHESDDNLLTLA